MATATCLYIVLKTLQLIYLNSNHLGNVEVAAIENHSVD